MCVYLWETCHYWHLHHSLLLSCRCVLFLPPSPFVTDTIIRLAYAVLFYGFVHVKSRENIDLSHCVCLAVCQTSLKFFCLKKVNTVSGWMTAPHCNNDGNQSIHMLTRSTVYIAVFFKPNIPLIWSQWQVSICCKLCYNKEQCLIQSFKFLKHPRWQMCHQAFGLSSPPLPRHLQWDRVEDNKKKE